VWANRAVQAVEANHIVPVADTWARITSIDVPVLVINGRLATLPMTVHVRLADAELLIFASEHSGVGNPRPPRSTASGGPPGSRVTGPAPSPR
jgi:hypothetical protein